MDGWEQSADHLVNSGAMLGITEYWCSSIIQQGILAPIEEVRPHNNTILSAMARHPTAFAAGALSFPVTFKTP